LTLKQAGSRTITATDTVTGTITGNTSLTINPANAATLALTAPASATAGSSVSPPVTAFDAYGNTAGGYTGTVHFNGSGTGTTHPPDYTFTGADNGSHTFSNAFTLTQAGSRTLFATDTVTGTITGNVTLTINPANAATLALAAPASVAAG